MKYSLSRETQVKKVFGKTVYKPTEWYLRISQYDSDNNLVLRHFFLFYFLIDNMAGSQLLVDIFQGNTHLNHQHQHVIAKIGNFINRFLFVIRFAITPPPT